MVSPLADAEPSGDDSTIRQLNKLQLTCIGISQTPVGAGPDNGEPLKMAKGGGDSTEICLWGLGNIRSRTVSNMQ